MDQSKDQTWASLFKNQKANNVKTQASAKESSTPNQNQPNTTKNTKKQNQNSKLVKPATNNPPNVSKKPKKKPLALGDFFADDQSHKTPLPPFVETIVHSNTITHEKTQHVIISEDGKPKKVALVPNPNPGSSERFVVRRGKERETPKPKKYTKLKKIILKEREMRYKEWQEELKQKEFEKQRKKHNNNSNISEEDNVAFLSDKELEAIRRKEFEEYEKTVMSAEDLRRQTEILESSDDIGDNDNNNNNEHNVLEKEKTIDADESGEKDDDSDSDHEETTNNPSVVIENHDENEETSLVPQGLNDESEDTENNQTPQDVHTITEDNNNNNNNNNESIKTTTIDDPKPIDPKEELARLSKIPRVPNNKPGPREYCKQVIVSELPPVVRTLLAELRRFYMRSKAIFALKGGSKPKRRYLFGLREILRNLERKKIKCVIMATNIEGISSSGGLDELTHGILKLCERQRIPVVFAMKRYELGKAIAKKVSVSAVGLIDFSGADEHYNKMITFAKEGRLKYNEIVKNKQKAEEERKKSTALEQSSPLELPKRKMNATAAVFVPRGIN